MSNRHPCRPFTLSPYVLLTAMLAACSAEPEALTEPTEPDGEPPPPVVLLPLVGSYQATELIVTRLDSARNLIGLPDNRISLRLDPGGRTVGQLKIASDRELRTKVPLDGRWRRLTPSSVTFDFVQPTFLSDIDFRIEGTQLSGDLTIWPPDFTPPPRYG